jgi:hypothetical protein
MFKVLDSFDCIDSTYLSEMKSHHDQKDTLLQTKFCGIVTTMTQTGAALSPTFRYCSVIASSCQSSLSTSTLTRVYLP